MKVQATEAVTSQPVEMEGAKDCRVRWLIGEGDGAPNFAMRQFQVAPGGHTPKHSHPYEHEVYVVSGAGTILEGDEAHPLKQGDVVYVAPDEIHQFQNEGEEPLVFLCLVPHSAATGKVTVVPECGVE